MMMVGETMCRLLIDFNHLAIRTLFANTKVNWNESFAFHKHLVLNTIFSNIKNFEPSEVVLAIDDRKNWRKKVYIDYKANRKLQRDASDFPWEKYFEHIEEFLESMKELPLKVIKVPFTEADDIIAVLSKHNEHQKNIILTSDSDYKQLLQYPQNRIYDPLKKKFMEEKEPLKCLKIKIVAGDSGDNIPSIKPRIGEKTAIKLIDTGQLETLLKEEEINKNYTRNEKLIDFQYIPIIIQKEILNKYIAYKFNDKPLDYHTWFVRHQLRELTGKLQTIVPMLMKLNKKEVEMTNLF